MEAVAAHGRGNLSRIAVSLVVVVLTGAVCAVAFAQWSAAASGTGSLFSSSGHALAGGSVALPDHRFVPGDTVTGTATVQNSGDAPGRFTFGVEQPAGARPIAGNALAKAMHVTVTDVTDPGAPQRVYRGRLCDLTGLDLGVFAAGVTRTYRLELSMPAGVSHAGASAPLDVSFGWTVITSG